jgi:hypothetical protein
MWHTESDTTDSVLDLAQNPERMAQTLDGFAPGGVPYTEVTLRVLDTIRGAKGETGHPQQRRRRIVIQVVQDAAGGHDVEGGQGQDIGLLEVTADEATARAEAGLRGGDVFAADVIPQVLDCRREEGQELAGAAPGIQHARAGGGSH